MRIKDKVALITGAASGIGRETALLFSREGAVVAAVDLDEHGGQALVQQIQAQGRPAVFVRCDVTQAADCQRAVQEVVTAFGCLNILINSAGIIRRTTVLNTTEEEWDRVMAVNVKSIYLLSRVAIPHMVACGGGVIINIGSGWGLRGGRDAVSYCASKGAVVNLTRAMALDHGEQRIRVNCLCPGDTDTPMLRGEARQLSLPEEQFLAEAARRPLQRIGCPEDIARAALYLASDDASFVTGAVLVVDGGGLAG